MRHVTVDELLAEARSHLVRLEPAEAAAAVEAGRLLIDIRGTEQVAADGVIPGALRIPRNVLEWRCDPSSPHRHPEVAGREQGLILICAEGYQSSLAAATLQRLGCPGATDVVGGFSAWRAAGLPVVAG